MAEAVGKAQLVEYGGDIVGVADMERVIEIVAGIHRKDQGRQHAEAEDCADDPFRPAAAGEHGSFFTFAFSMANYTGRLVTNTPSAASSAVVRTTRAMAVTG